MEKNKNELKSHRHVKSLKISGKLLRREADKKSKKGDQVDKTHQILVRNLRYWMDKKGIRAIELAKMLGKDPSTVSNWLTGKSAPIVSQLGTIADIFDIPVAALFADPNDHREVETPPEGEQEHAEKVARIILDGLGLRAGKLTPTRKKKQ